MHVDLSLTGGCVRERAGGGDLAIVLSGSKNSGRFVAGAQFRQTYKLDTMLFMPIARAATLLVLQKLQSNFICEASRNQSAN